MIPGQINKYEGNHPQLNPFTSRDTCSPTSLSFLIRTTQISITIEYCYSSPEITKRSHKSRSISSIVKMSESTEVLVPKSKEGKQAEDEQGESKQPELKQHNEADPNKDGEEEVKQLEIKDLKMADADEGGSAESKEAESEDQNIVESGEGGSAESKKPESEEHKSVEAEAEGKSTGDKGKEHEFQPRYHKHFLHTMEKLEDIKEKLKVFNARCHKLHGRK
jgi:hypothetical protein